VDLTELAAVAGERAAAAVVIGESGPLLAKLFGAAGLARIETAASLDEAVRTADVLAREALENGGATVGTVLLSPAAASFDMFVDYAARGRAFKEAVGRLATDRRRRGAR
jgi:UDP-N-acetylmuramoylalanine--D-glutamate ligase